MSAPFELEITVCAGGSGHVTTAIEVQNLADLESLSRAVTAAIQVWQEARVRRDARPAEDRRHDDASS